MLSGKASLFLNASLAFVMMTFVVACNTSHEGSLFSDQLSISDCPENSCAQGIADAAETRLILTSPISNVLPASSSLGEVSGDCYASLFPQNFFDIQILNPSGQAMDVASRLPSGFTPKCVNGKFYIPINLQNQAAGAYTVNLQLVVVDSKGQQTRPAFKSISSKIVLN